MLKTYLTPFPSVYGKGSRFSHPLKSFVVTGGKIFVAKHFQNGRHLRSFGNVRTRTPCGVTSRNAPKCYLLSNIEKDREISHNYSNQMQHFYCIFCQKL